MVTNTRENDMAAPCRLITDPYTSLKLNSTVFISCLETSILSCGATAESMIK